MKGEANILDVVFKEKKLKIAFDNARIKKSLEYGYEYWDDPQYPGYAGYYYDGRWKDPAKKLLAYFDIQDGQSVVDVCCGKGFLMYELSLLNPSLDIRGIDISTYAIENAKEEVRGKIIEGTADELPFEDKSIDLVYSLNSLYMLPERLCIESIKEIERVGNNAFIQVNSFYDEKQKENLIKWDHTTSVVKSVDEWRSLFKDIGYSGYYYWTVFL